MWMLRNAVVNTTRLKCYLICSHGWNKVVKVGLVTIVYRFWDFATLFSFGYSIVRWQKGFTSMHLRKQHICKGNTYVVVFLETNEMNTHKKKKIHTFGFCKMFFSGAHSFPDIFQLKNKNDKKKKKNFSCNFELLHTTIYSFWRRVPILM